MHDHRPPATTVPNEPFGNHPPEFAELSETEAANLPQWPQPLPAGPVNRKHFAAQDTPPLQSVPFRAPSKPMLPRLAGGNFEPMRLPHSADPAYWPEEALPASSG